MHAAAATVQRLRLHAPAAGSAEAARAQRAVRRWLDGVEPARYGLPAQAIVAVRQLHTRLPALVAGSPWPDPLAAVLRSAARPAAQPAVGAAVAAVWFADEAELLACLARDALAARAAWWWPLLLGQAPDIAAATARWCRAPTQLPRAVRRLAAAEGAAWLQAVGPAGRGALLQALCTAFGVADGVRGWVAAGDATTPPARPTADMDAEAGAAALPAALPSAPVAAAAGRLQRLLRAVADDALAAASAAQAAAWCPELAPHHAALRSSPRLEVAVAAVAPAGPRRAPDVGVAVGSAALRPAAGWVAAARRAGDPPAPWPVGTRRGAAAADTLPPAARAQQPRNAPADHAAGRSSRHVLPVAPAATAPAGAADTDVDVALDTRYGGLVFLLNVALSMGLYGDFTQPLRPGLAHTPWQFLHALGRAWGGRDYGADALSRLLRLRAAGHPWPRATTAWTIDCEALQAHAADPQPWHAITSAGELRLWHPAGFWLARRPVARDPQAAALAMLRDLGAEGRTLCWHGADRRALAGAGAGAGAGASASASGWAGTYHARQHGLQPDPLADLAPLLRLRLARALGLPRPQAAVALTLRLPARLRSTPGRLDLHFELAALPLALRLAGLDRDPGWVPAAGCDFRFHFH